MHTFAPYIYLPTYRVGTNNRATDVDNIAFMENGQRGWTNENKLNKSKKEQKATREKVAAKEEATEARSKRLAKRVCRGCSEKYNIKRDYHIKHKSGGSKSGNSSAGSDIDQLTWDSSQ